MIYHELETLQEHLRAPVVTGGNALPILETGATVLDLVLLMAAVRLVLDLGFRPLRDGTRCSTSLPPQGQW